MDVVGYTDRLSACPGEEVRVMVSCARPEYHAELVRLIHGDVHPEGPGFKASQVPSEVEGPHPGQHQLIACGSHMEVSRVALVTAFTVAVWAWPTSLEAGRQGLLGHVTWREHGLALILEGEGHVALWVDGLVRARSPVPMTTHSWSMVVATHDRASGQALIGLGPINARIKFTRASNGPGESNTGMVSSAPFWVGAADATTHFNGKLEAPLLCERMLSVDELERLHADPDSAEGLDGVLASWDFARDMSTRQVVDASGRGHDGRLVNLPTRAVTGRRWDGHEIDCRLVPEQYAAIHFHDDDLDDAQWDPSISWQVPAELASGVYAIRLTCEDTEDFVPVFVRPSRGTRQSDAALLIPTFSYLAYANEHMMNDIELQALYRELGGNVVYPVQPQDHYILDQQLHSLYDRHSDGSGVCYASWLRPLLSMRPKYYQGDVAFDGGAAHQLNADLHLVDWLYEHDFPVDVITDLDLHKEGVELLGDYRVLITGTHPEYVSQEILDALTSYAHSGGRIMYLGGNGLYWVAGLDPEEEHTIEVRRWGPATRAWDAAPGEWYLSTASTAGGLWRYRGRSPQRLLGVGFTAQGIGENRSYKRTTQSYDPRYAFVFEGLEADEEIGAHGSLINDWGAAGFEIDRFDAGLGSPERTTVLASATGFSDLYQHVVDDVLASDSRQGGSVNPHVRADMVLVEHPGGGVVFSTSSIAWCACLSHNNYENSVSRVTSNVLRQFLIDDVFLAPASDVGEPRSSRPTLGT